MKKVTVFGATGAQGSPVVTQAHEAGFQVRAVARSAEKVRERHGDAVEAVAADFDDAASLAAALEGVDAAFAHLPIPSTPEQPQVWLTNFLTAAKASNLPLLIFSTTGPTGTRYGSTPIIDGNNAAVQAVQASGIPAVILQPTVYIENLQVPVFVPALYEQGILDYPPMRESQRLSWVSHVDQAKIAVAAMARPDLSGNAYEIASPEPLTGPQLAAVFAKWLGKDVRFKQVSPADYGARIGEEMGNPGFGFVLAGLYEVLAALPDDGLVIDTGPLEQTFGVTLTSAAQQIMNWPRP